VKVLHSGTFDTKSDLVMNIFRKTCLTKKIYFNRYGTNV